MSSRSIKEIQQALQAKGFKPGEIDGVWGRNTISAVRQFQERNGLLADGIVGPKTTTALFESDSTLKAGAALPSSSLIIPWYEEAKNLIGTGEFEGSGDNPEIMEWANDLDIQYPGDDVPWCGLFVAHCIGSTLPGEVLPGNPLGARQWEKFGEQTTPRLGAVMVFWRESDGCGKGHVGFYAGEDGNAFQILGGNQSNKVCLTWISKDRFLGAKWPKTASMLISQSVKKGRTEGISQNEA